MFKRKQLFIEALIHSLVCFKWSEYATSHFTCMCVCVCTRAFCMRCNFFNSCGLNRNLLCKWWTKPQNYSWMNANGGFGFNICLPSSLSLPPIRTRSILYLGIRSMCERKKCDHSAQAINCQHIFTIHKIQSNTYLVRSKSTAGVREIRCGKTE